MSELKGKIDKDGSLYIERAGAMKPARCPHAEQSCGDWCALFGEPVTDTDYLPLIVLLSLCVATHEFDEFTDERIRPTEAFDTATHTGPMEEIDE